MRYVVKEIEISGFGAVESAGRLLRRGTVKVPVSSEAHGTTAAVTVEVTVGYRPGETLESLERRLMEEAYACLSVTCAQMAEDLRQLETA